TTVCKFKDLSNCDKFITETVKHIVDKRDIFEESRDQLLDKIHKHAETIASDRGISCSVKRTSSVKPIPIEESYKKELKNILDDMGIDSLEVPSGAGHDSMNIGLEIPVAMIFTRSKDGISHNPKDRKST